MIMTKMSIIDHLPRKSSHAKAAPRFSRHTSQGGVTHRPHMTPSLTYGHAPEKTTTTHARNLAPALYMSMVD